MGGDAAFRRAEAGGGAPGHEGLAAVLAVPGSPHLEEAAGPADQEPRLASPAAALPRRLPLPGSALGTLLAALGPAVQVGDHATVRTGPVVVVGQPPQVLPHPRRIQRGPNTLN